MKSPFKYALVAVVVLVAAGAFAWSRRTPEQVAIGGPFTLLDSAGHTVTDQAFRG